MPRAPKPAFARLKRAAERVLGRALAPTELAIYASLHRSYPYRLTPRRMMGDHHGTGLTQSGIESALRRMLDREILTADGTGRERVYDFPEAFVTEALEGEHA